MPESSTRPSATTSKATTAHAKTSPRTGMAILSAKASRIAIASLTKRPGGSIPGMIAMRIQPDVLDELAQRLSGLVCITGTNGKTTTTGIVADVLRRLAETGNAGMVGTARTIVSNHDGNNMTNGIVTTLATQTKGSDTRLLREQRPFGVFEVDELYTKVVLPALRPQALLLLNLFRDQLDRYAEIDRTQKAIATALMSSPSTLLVYNADDPMCEIVASTVRKADRQNGRDGNRCIPFWCDIRHTDATLTEHTQSAAESRLCPSCGMPMEYDAIAYAQLGGYHCPHCGWGHVPYDDGNSTHAYRYGFAVGTSPDGTEHVITLSHGYWGEDSAIAFRSGGLYMDYNAVAALALIDSITCDASQDAADGTHACGQACQQQAVELAAMRETMRGLRVAGGRNGTWHGMTASMAMHGKTLVQRHRMGNGRLPDIPVTVRTCLAKNPAGFNRMLREAADDGRTDAILLMLNDRDADGHDVSWIWDVDMEGIGIDAERIYVGGDRQHDMGLRVMYTGHEVAGHAGDASNAVYAVVSDMLKDGTERSGIGITVIANYTAFTSMTRELSADRYITLDDPANDAVTHATSKLAADAMKRRADIHRIADDVHDAEHTDETTRRGIIVCEGDIEDPDISDDEGNRVADMPAGRTLTVMWLYPDAMNLYGDRGNAVCISERIRMMGMGCELRTTRLGENIDLDGVDICLIGGGSDRDQRTVMREIRRGDNGDEIRRYIDDGGVMLAICGGFQMLGRSYTDATTASQPGLGIIGMDTVAPDDGSRLVGNVAIRACDGVIDTMRRYAAHTSDGLQHDGHRTQTLIVGFENHGGRTILDSGVPALGSCYGETGNDGKSGYEGACHKHLVGTYIHGPILPKNPMLADTLIAIAYERKYGRRLLVMGKRPSSTPDSGIGYTTWLGSQDTLRAEEMLARQDAIDRYDARRDAIGR